jgi:hypothetical protein
MLRQSIWRCSKVSTFCNSDRIGKTDEEQVEEIRKRVEAKQVQFVYKLVIITMDQEVLIT